MGGTQDIKPLVLLYLYAIKNFNYGSKKCGRIISNTLLTNDLVVLIIITTRSADSVDKAKLGDNMRINTRFPVAVHLLVLVAIKGEDLTSEVIAKSVNTNPVVIRRINTLLKKANIITVKAGVGGTVLNRAPQEITLLDIYKAVRTSSNELIFDLHNNPNLQCPVGSNIHEALTEPFINAQEALENSLKNYTLADIADGIMAKYHAVNSKA